jgi:hypothetical protein
MLVVGILVLVAVSLPLPVLTAIGGHQRGLPIPFAILSGIFFPVTWAVWHLRDEHPYRRTKSRAL